MMSQIFSFVLEHKNKIAVKLNLELMSFQQLISLAKPFFLVIFSGF